MANPVIMLYGILVLLHVNNMMLRSCKSHPLIWLLAIEKYCIYDGFHNVLTSLLGTRLGKV